MIKNLVIFVLFVVLSITSYAQQNFEGIIDVTVMNSRGEKNDLKLYTRGDALKLETEDEDVKNGNIIINKESIYILMPEQKKYIQMPMNVNNKVKNYSAKADSLQRTGETKEILDYQAEKWLFTENGTTVEIWSTKELGNVLDITNFIPDAVNETWYSTVFAEGFFPLSMIVTNSTGKIVNKIEVTNIEKEDLEDADFNLPAGFEKMETSNK